MVEAHGFRLVPATHLETPVAMGPDRAEVSLYAALFEPEAEPPWL
ncbi:hypothetical protein [Lentzea flava]|uniref:Uncharacterized protein n=1 Tax=Lentzea flava TaxID=103732 RepID=A0ABQ2UAM0_9PSEU|nr:hypothetical protein [Lentzea flava]MCP2196688.1 hypothetical protein [Lentzea flava]GGU16230.1 hypothetical protein GCM10010178_04840 [Lentzea flava]